MNSTNWPHDPAADEAAALWAARLDGSELTLEDRRELENWLGASSTHRSRLSFYCQFSADLEQQLPLLEGIKDEAAEARKAPETASPYPWLHRPRWAGVALAAAAAIALAFWLARPPEQTRNLATATAVAQRRSLTLADGSQIELNAQTSLQVEFDARERHVRLATGEAFFSVSKNPSRPFVVESPAGSVRVTGTQFNVRADGSSLLEVTVVEGSVQARPAGRDAAPIALTPGEQLRSDSRGISVHTLSAHEVDDTTAWRQGQVVFKDTPLREALERFARYHGRGLTVTADAANLRIGGRFRLDDLDGFLAALEEVLPVRVTRDLSGNAQVSLRPTS